MLRMLVKQLADSYRRIGTMPIRRAHAHAPVAAPGYDSVALLARVATDRLSTVTRLGARADSRAGTLSWRQLFIVTLVMCCGAAAAFAESTLSRVAEPAIHQEARVFGEVIGAALKRANVPTTREVTSHYLKGQGVLLSIRLHRRSQNFGEYRYDFDGDLSDIPAFVRDILQRVDVPARTTIPEELEILEELRKEQREIRKEQRDLLVRSRDLHRKQRRRADDNVAEDIEQVNQQLALTEADYDRVAQEIEEYYERFRANREDRSQRASTSAEQQFTAVQSALLETVCNYRTSLPSLPRQEHVTVFLPGARRANDGHSNDDLVMVIRQSQLAECASTPLTPTRLANLGDLYWQ